MSVQTYRFLPLHFNQLQDLTGQKSKLLRKLSSFMLVSDNAVLQRRELPEVQHVRVGIVASVCEGIDHELGAVVRARELSEHLPS